MNVVGLDLSLTATGIAYADGSFTTVTTAAKGEERIVALRSAVLNAVIFADLVVIEGYSMASRHGAHQLGELGGVIRVALHEAGIPFVEIAPTRLKKWATGKGNANKDEMLVRAARLWPTVTTNDEADAGFLRQMGLTAHGEYRPTKAQADLLGQVDWPVLPAPPEPPWGNGPSPDL